MSGKTYPMKCRIRATDSGATRVDIMDDIGQDFWGDGLTAKSFAGQLAEVRGPLDVHVNSGGGDVFDGLAIGEAIRSHKGPVTVYVDGIAASIASVIVQAAQQRVMAPGSMMMIHDAYGGVDGNEAAVAKFAETLGKVSDNIAAVYAGRGGGSPESWRQAMKTETWYTADEAVTAGLADRVGSDKAQLPAGLDLAAYSAVPGRIAAALRSMPHAADGGASLAEQHGHPGQPCADPDGDGDCDQSAAGDTDHDYWTADGKQVKPLPGQAQDALTEARVRAVIREELVARGLLPGLDGFVRPANADKYKQADRDQMAKSGQAMDDGSYPIADEEDLDNAIHAVGRGGADHDSIRQHIIKRAAALGLSSKIPDSWNADGSLKEQPENSISGSALSALFVTALEGAKK